MFGIPFGIVKHPIRYQYIILSNKWGAVQHKEILYFLSIRLYSTAQLAQLRGQSDRNIRKVRNTIRKKLQKKLYAHLCQMQDEGKSLTLRERQFMEEYAALLGEKGKDAVIRRENKTKRRKKKAALDGGKDSE